MEDIADGPEAADAGTKRACDQCRMRKIRCDKETPCSNCRIAQRQCVAAGVGHKPKEGRQRVLISAQYERKIDQIEERLAGIEKLLRGLASRHGSLSTGPSPSQEAPSSEPRTPLTTVEAGSSVAYDGPEDDEGTSAFEGNSSLAAHAAFATTFLENAVERTSLRDLSPDMSDAVLSLQQIVGMQSRRSASQELRFPHQKPLPKGGLRELPMPPMPVVISMLREIKDNPPVSFTLTVCFVAIEDYTEMCRRIYFPAEEYSAATFIIVNHGLYYLFLEKAAEFGRNFKALEAEGYAEMCRDNLETALASLHLFMPAKKDNVTALLLGASWAVELAKPTIAAMLTSRAVNMCHDLGWHRATTSKGKETDADATTQAVLFWTAYMMDKGMSLSLGRAPTIQDYDVTRSRDIGELRAGTEWRFIMNGWIKLAEVQGNLYQRLYSPAALLQSDDERERAARGLGEELKILMTQMHLAATSRSPGRRVEHNGDVVGMINKSDEVSIWSTLTLAYRALPPLPGSGSSFHPDCIEAARDTMQLHMESMQMLGDNDFLASAYINWTILFAPFIPFIILFCHIIEMSDLEELARLGDFVATLERLTKTSTAVEKLHRLCQVLHNVARLYVEAKAKPQDQGVPPLGNEVDLYLSALGLVPGDLMADPGMNAMPAGQTQFLGDWFSGNRQMIELLEQEDLMNWSGTQ